MSRRSRLAGISSRRCERPGTSGRRAGSLGLALGWTLFAVWVVGQIARDRTLVTAWAFYLPSAVVLGALCCWRSARRCDAVGGEPACGSRSPCCRLWPCCCSRTVGSRRAERYREQRREQGRRRAVRPAGGGLERRRLPARRRARGGGAAAARCRPRAALRGPRKAAAGARAPARGRAPTDARRRDGAASPGASCSTSSGWRGRTSCRRPWCAGQSTAGRSVSSP